MASWVWCRSRTSVICFWRIHPRFQFEGWLKCQVWTKKTMISGHQVNAERWWKKYHPKKKKQNILSKLIFLCFFGSRVWKKNTNIRNNKNSMQEDKQLCDNRVVTSYLGARFCSSELPTQVLITSWFLFFWKFCPFFGWDLKKISSWNWKKVPRKKWKNVIHVVFFGRFFSEIFEFVMFVLCFSGGEKSKGGCIPAE